jgi:hypothetical protein
MNKEERAKASKDQIERFFYSYYSHWRLAKILINEKILLNKYEILKDITLEIQQADDKNPEALIAQELKNGLEFDTLANCLQFIEDLFALLKAGKQKDFFIRNIITYNAGQIENLINHNFTDKELCELFYFPYFTEFENEEFKEGFTDGLTQLKNRIAKIQEFYKAYHFFYIQYKHGLTVALRPYSNFVEEQIQKDKQNEMEPYLVAFDNLSIRKVFGNKSRFQNYVFMPCLTVNTQPFLGTLEKEDNLIRFVMTPPGTTIEKFKDCAMTVRECMHIFINNFLTVLRDGNPLELQLPSEFKRVYQFKFPVEMLNDKKKTNS